MQMRSIIVIGVLASAVSSVALAASFSAGINISEEVAPEKTGLRIYPGAALVVKKKGKDDSADIQFVFGEYGLKIVAAKLRSMDAPGKVAQFYRDDLKRFGEVLDCSNPQAVETKLSKDEKSKVLTCDGDKPRRNNVLYKVGRKDDQHVVEIKPSGEGSEFSLVHVKMRSPE
ncbi:MAG: hypothetical protein LH481_12000 [Burkholderiales bacterium]|nr:hypothetical protein [Burkholderiales bacterium]